MPNTDYSLPSRQQNMPDIATGPTAEENDRMGWYIGHMLEKGMTAEQIEFFLNAGYIPNESQIDFHAACNLCDGGDVIEILFEGPKGGGKTHACFMELVFRCNKHPLLKGLYIRKTKQSAKEIMEDISLKSLRLVPHTPQQKRIIFPNGSYIRVGGYNTSNDLMDYHGANAEIIVIDELTSIRQEAYADLIANVRSARPGWQARMLASTNPGLIGHMWVKDHFIMPKRENRETTTRCIHSNTEDNILLGNYKETNLEQLRGQKREMWLEGNWDLQVGQAFDFSDLRHVVKGSAYYFEYNGVRHVIDDSWIRIAGVDFGTSKPFCYLAGALDPHIGRLYVYKEIYATGLGTKDQARRINLYTGEDEYITVTYCDPAMKRTHDNDPNTSAIDDYADLGIYLTPGDRKRVDGKWKIDNLLATKADGMPGLIINKTCRNLIDQLATLTRDETNPEDIDTDLEDHAYDALRYMLSRYRDTSMRSTPSTEREQKFTHYQTMQQLFV